MSSTDEQYKVVGSAALEAVSTPSVARRARIIEFPGASDGRTASRLAPSDARTGLERLQDGLLATATSTDRPLAVRVVARLKAAALDSETVRDCVSGSQRHGTAKGAVRGTVRFVATAALSAVAAAPLAYLVVAL